MNWGLQIKKLRQERHMTQGELAKRSGLTRSHISTIEMGRYQSLKQDTFNRLARGLNMNNEALSKELYAPSVIPKETPEQILERLKLATPVSIPIYDEFPFHAGEPVEPTEYVYRARPKSASKNIEGYLVHGGCLEPKVNDGDIIIVDREAVIDNGDIVACLIDGRVHLARLRKVADELWLENNEGRVKYEECQVAAPVIEVIRRLK